MRIAWSPLLAVALATAFAGAGERPDFTGGWRLNEELSDDARQKLREAFVARMRDRGPGGRRGAPGGRRRPAGEMRDRLRRMEKGIQRLTIAHDEDAVVIRNAIDREHRVVADGRTRTREGGFGPVETRAEWKRRSLVIVDRPEQGAVVTRTYFHRRDDPHLYVNVKVEGRGPVFEYLRVYDRVEEEGSGGS
jgi:xanthine/CO dehydrogenase XdhC/CoxF family maturation factor